MAALFLLTLALVGNGVRPTLIAFFTDSVFADPIKLGMSMALALAVTAPISLISAYFGIEEMRRAVDLLESELQRDSATDV